MSLRSWECPSQLAWARGEHEYMMMLEEFLGRLELPHACDMDRVDDVDPSHRDVITWLESELCMVGVLG